MSEPVLGPASLSLEVLREIRDELRRANASRDQFYREVLDILTAAKNPPATKGFGYYAEDPSEMCTARCHPDRRAWHRCLRMAGHEGLHEDGMGNAFSKDYPKSEGSLRSGQPEAATDGQEGGEPRVCRVCGKPDVLVVCTEGDGPLTREQWVKHHDALYYESGEYGASKVNAAYWADSQMENRFGPCPEES